MSSWLLDLRYGLRTLVRNPTSSLIAVVTLALGIGAVGAILSVLNAVYLDPLPFEDADRLALVLSSIPEDGVEFSFTSFQNVEDWRQENDVFSAFAAASASSLFTLIADDGTPSSYQGEYVSPELFEVLGLSLPVGRPFGADDNHPGADKVVILSDHLWRQRFAADPAILSSTLQVNGHPFKVIGVAPPEYRGWYWDRVDLLLPVALAGELEDASHLEDRARTWLAVLARLAPGVDFDRARSSMNLLAEQLEAAHPKENDGRRVTVLPLSEFYFGADEGRLLRLLTLGSALVLLVCCANVATLLLTQLLKRRQEMAVRSALGANRRSLGTLFAWQTMILALTGGIAGIGVAQPLSRTLIGLSDLSPASFAGSYLDWRVIASTLLLTLVVGLVFGVMPVLLLPRFRILDLLKSRSQGGKTPGRLRNILVVSEVALVIALMVSAGLMIRTVRAFLETDPGFRTERLYSVQLNLAAGQYADAAGQRSFVRRFTDSVASLPEVESVSVAGPQLVPQSARTRSLFAADTMAREPESEGIRVYWQTILPGHLENLEARLLEGRLFNNTDDERSVFRAVIDQATAETVWPQGALGQHFRVTPVIEGDPSFEVIGVVGNIKNRGVDAPPGPQRDIYFSYYQVPYPDLFLVIRARLALGKAGSSETLFSKLRDRAKRVDPSLALYNFESIDGRLAAAARDRQSTTAILGAFSLVGLLLAAIGVYGALAVAVTQRRQEIGIRMAMGATPAAVLGRILGRAMALVGLGLAIGLVLAFFVARAMQGALYGIAPTDPTTLLVVTALLLVVALVASIVPARRATRLDPSGVIREES